MKLNRTKHTLPSSISQKELYKRLHVLLQHPDLKIENKKHCIQVSFRNKSSHSIWLDEEKRTYSIASRSQANRNFKDRHNPAIKEYSYGYTIYPIIKSTIEDALQQRNAQKENSFESI